MSDQRLAVFLDRDGVLNRAVVRDGRPYPPECLAKMELTPDAKTACSALRNSGYLLILVTNQPDIARGAQTRRVVDEMNDWLQGELALDDVRLCPHDDRDACSCRKPAPGMLTEASQHWNIDLQQSFMVGDRWRDIEAGKRAGCRTVFIDRGYAEKRPLTYDHATPDLPGAAKWILNEHSS